MGKTADLIEALPDRFRAEKVDGLAARFRVVAGRTTRDVVVDGRGCTVELGAGAADASIHTDARTWAAIDAGRLSGIEAFAARRLSVRGSIERALLFETFFSRPDAGGLRYDISRVQVDGSRMSVLTAGDSSARPVVLLHGLGGTKASFLTIVAGLAQHHRVIAPDLLGFGASDKPRGAYSAPWFGDSVFRLLDELGHQSSLVAGNSMGGRIAMEMAMMEPERVDAIACLCPAAAFSRRPLLLLARLARAELGMAVRFLPRAQIREVQRQFFADPSRIDEAWYDAALDDFLRTWRSAAARRAFFAAARRIYLDEPDGDSGFWARLALMERPALYVYGRNDVVISHRFAWKVAQAVSSARVEVWDDCGHVPQLEHPERTVPALLEFFSGVTERREAV